MAQSITKGSEPKFDESKSKPGKKSFKPRRGGKPYVEKKGEPEYVGNHPTWFKNYPELAEIATRIPWFHIKGTTFDGGSGKFNIANVTRVHFAPTLGISTGATSPLNLAFRKMWIEMNKEFRGISTYESADLAMACIALASLFSHIGEAYRLYGIANTFVDIDRTTGSGLLQACGLNSNQITWLYNHLSDFQFSLNALVTAANSLVLPRGFSLLKSWLSLTSAVYTDSKDSADRATSIVFVPDYYFTYNEDSEGLPTILIAKENCIGEGNNLNAYLLELENNIQYLLQSEDINKMCADLMAFFVKRGTGEPEVLPLLPTQYKIVPEYDENILLKLHNANVAPTSTTSMRYSAMTGNTLDNMVFKAADRVPVYNVINANEFHLFVISQEDNNVLFNPYIRQRKPLSGSDYVQRTFNGRTGYVILENALRSGTISTLQSYNIPMFYTGDTFLDTWNPNPSNDDVLEAVLWKAVYNYDFRISSDSEFKCYAYISSCALEVITGLEMLSIVKGRIEDTQRVQNILPLDMLSVTSIAKCVSALNKLDWHPLLYVGTDVEEATPEDFIQGGYVNGDFTVSPIGDTDNACIIPNKTIAKIHDVEMLSAYYIDYMKLDSTK